LVRIKVEASAKAYYPAFGEVLFVFRGLERQGLDYFNEMASSVKLRKFSS